MSKNIQHSGNCAIFMDLTALSQSFDVAKYLEKSKQHTRLLLQKAYTNSEVYAAIKMEMANIAMELVELPFSTTQHSDSVTISLTVDVLEAVYTKPQIDAYILFLGNNDYTALFLKLRSLDKRCIVVCNDNEKLNLWKSYCDEVYDENSFLEKAEIYIPEKVAPVAATKPEGRSLYSLLRKAITDLSETEENVYDWQIKEHIEKSDPSFNIAQCNVKTWENLWIKAQADNVIVIKETENGLAFSLYNPARLQEEKAELIRDSLQLFLQAIKISPTTENGKINLNDLALAIRKISPNFKPYSSRGNSFKALMLDIEEKGYVQVFSDVLQGSIQYSMRVLPKFYEEFGKRESQPSLEKPPIQLIKANEKPEYSNNDQISYSAFIWSQNLYADIATIKSLYEMIDEYVFSAHANREVSIKEVFSYCISLQTSSYNEQICRRVFNTLLASNILYTANNNAITRLYIPAVVEEIELFEDAEVLMKNFIIEQLKKHFGANLDDNKLQQLFYGRKSNATIYRMTK